MNKKQAQAGQVLPWDNPRFRNWIAVARQHRPLGVLCLTLGAAGPENSTADMMMNTIYRHPGMSQQNWQRN